MQGDMATEVLSLLLDVAHAEETPPDIVDLALRSHVKILDFGHIADEETLRRVGLRGEFGDMFVLWPSHHLMGSIPCCRSASRRVLKISRMIRGWFQPCVISRVWLTSILARMAHNTLWNKTGSPARRCCGTLTNSSNLKS
jgi:hypothetical protein